MYAAKTINLHSRHRSTRAQCAAGRHSLGVRVRKLGLNSYTRVHIGKRTMCTQI